MIRHDIRRSVWCGDPLSLVPGSRGDPSWTVSTAVMFSAVPPVQSVLLPAPNHTVMEEHRTHSVTAV